MSNRLRFPLALVLMVILFSSFGCGTGSNQSGASSFSSTSTSSTGAQNLGSISGRVLDDQGNPVSNATVRFTPSRAKSVASPYSNKTDSAGYYGFRAPEGDGTVTVTSGRG